MMFKMFTTWLVSPASREARSTSATSCQSRRSCRAGNTKDIFRVGSTGQIRPNSVPGQDWGDHHHSVDRVWPSLRYIWMGETPCIAHWICRPNYPCVNIVHSERLQAQMVWNCQCPGRRVHLLSWSVAPPTGFVLPCCLNLPPVPLRKMVGRYAVSLFLLDFHSTSNLYLTSFPFFACLFREHFGSICLSPTYVT